jgi:hypothetical protein
VRRGVPIVVLLPIYGCLNTRDNRHAGIEQDEQHDESADESREYDV